MGGYITDPELVKDLAETTKERRRVNQVQDSLATKEGLLDKAKQYGIGFLQTPIVRSLMDGVQRWESARAVAFEQGVLQGGGQQALLEGFFTEMIGDTKLGKWMGLEDPSKRTFGDVLEKAGVGEGGTLSDVVGDQWFTPYFDPSSRGALAFATDVALDPTTYLTFGAGTAAKQVVGKAGVVNLTEKGAQLVENVYKSRVLKAAQEAGEGVADVAKMTLDDFAEVEAKVLQRQRDAMGMEGLAEIGIEHARAKLQDEAGRRVADRLAREGTEGLMYEGGVRMFDMTWLGGSYRGITVLPESAYKPVADAVKNAIRAGTPKPILNNVDGVVDFLDKTFKRVPRVVRANAIFRQMEEARFVTRNSADRVAKEHIDHVFGGYTDMFLKDKEASKLLMHYIEDPEKYKGQLIRYFGKDADGVHNVAQRWKALADGMGGAAVKLQFLEPEQFAAWSGRYIPHELLNLPDEYVENVFQSAARPAAEIAQEFKGGSIYRYGNERHAKSLDDLRRILKERGYDPDKHINYNVIDSMQKYIKTHVNGVADANFANDLVAEFSPTFQTILRNLAPDTAGLAEKITPDQLKAMNIALRRPQQLKGLPMFEVEYQQALDAIGNMPPVQRAAYVYERLMRVENLEDFSEFMRTNAKVLDKVSNKDLSRLRDFMKTGNYKVDGHYVTKHVFTEGAMKGQSRLIPAHMKEYFEQNSKRLSRGLPKELEAALKKYDLIVNSFKVNHTVFAMAFHTRNAISNLAAASATLALIPMLNPARMARVLRIMREEGDFTVKTATGARYTRQHLSRMHQAHDITPLRKTLSDVAGDARTLGDTKVGRMMGLKHAENFFTTLGQANENFARSTYFQTLIERGYSARRAAQLTKDTFFDYSDLSFTEQQVFKRIMPFYTWTRKNVELQANNWLKRPGASITQVKLANQERGPEANLLPYYMNGDLKVQLKSDPGHATFITNIDLPVQNLNIIWNGGLRETIREHFNMISPFVKAPLEYNFEQQNFGGRSLRGMQFMGTVGEQIAKTWSTNPAGKALVEWLELEPVELRSGEVAYKGNALKMWLLFNNGIVGRLIRDTTVTAATAMELGDGDKAEGSRMLLRLLTGLNIEHIDLEEAQKRKFQESIKWLENFSAEHGAGYKYEVFVPAKGGE